MKIDVLTLFPQMFSGPLSESLIGKAWQAGLVDINIVNIRDFASDKHKTVDDASYGGGVGMVMKPDVLSAAVLSVKKENSKIILLSAGGKKLDQKMVLELSKEKHLVMICGHYEGIDERFAEKYKPMEISIGDYVLTGGELPAMVLIDALARFIPGVVGDQVSVEQDSFYEGMLDFPHYTRPEEFEGQKVPEVLLSGDHKKIAAWRREQALKRTLFNRPDLMAADKLSAEDKKLLAGIVLNQ